MREVALLHHFGESAVQEGGGVLSPVLETAGGDKGGHVVTAVGTLRCCERFDLLPVDYHLRPFLLRERLVNQRNVREGDAGRPIPCLPRPGPSCRTRPWGAVFPAVALVSLFELVQESRPRLVVFRVLGVERSFR